MRLNNTGEVSYALELTLTKMHLETTDELVY